MILPSQQLISAGWTKESKIEESGNDILYHDWFSASYSKGFKKQKDAVLSQTFSPSIDV